ncbi:MAG: hemerythrin domain-containing protein [Nitrospirae bacterium]|nr:MAG: hemerythrin domain-containing protein [Nitrospirota bacterium]
MRSMVPDPLHLLKREHEVMLDHLRMIETTIAPRTTRSRVTAEPDRRTLCELFRFFTDRVSIHFSREAVLMVALSRSFGQEQTARKRFEGLRREHRELRADAAGIMKALNGKSSGASGVAGTDPFRIRSFIQRYRTHLAYEERILFVLAELRLTVEQRLRISHRMLQM